MRKRGRPPAPLTTGHPQHTALIKALELGAPITLAAQTANLHPSTIHNWRNRGLNEIERTQTGHPPRPDQHKYRAFYEDTERARACGAVANLEVLKKSSEGGFPLRETRRRFRDVDSGEVVEEVETVWAPPTWQAAAWLLERTRPGEFGRPGGSARVEVTGSGGGPVVVASVDVGGLAERIVSQVSSRRVDEVEGPVVEGVVVSDSGSGDV